jgi:hypothetical protein
MKNMKNMKNIIVIFAISSLLFASCQQNNNILPPPTPIGSIDTLKLVEVTVLDSVGNEVVSYSNANTLNSFGLEGDTASGSLVMAQNVSFNGINAQNPFVMGVSYTQAPVPGFTQIVPQPTLISQSGLMKINFIESQNCQCRWSANGKVNGNEIETVEYLGEHTLSMRRYDPIRMSYMETGTYKVYRISGKAKTKFKQFNISSSAETGWMADFEIAYRKFPVFVKQ